MQVSKTLLLSYVLALILIIGIVLAAPHVHINQDMEPIIDTDDVAVDISLSSSTTIRQSFIATGNTITGVVLYSHQPTIKPFSISLVIKDASQTILAQGTNIRSTYRNDKQELIIPVSHTRPAAGSTVWLEITSQETDNTIIATSQAIYPSGVLASNTFLPEDAGNIPFEIIYPTPLSSAQLQGIYIGTIFFAACLCIHFISHLWPKKSYSFFLGGIVLLGMSILTATSFLGSYDKLGIGDWDYRFSLFHIYEKTISTWRQFPLWNPYMCGGAAALGDPEFSVISPAFLFTALFGVHQGFIVAITFALAALSIGMYMLAKEMRLSVMACLLTGMVAAYTSAVILKIVEGHTTIIFAYLWVPWVLLSYLKAYRASSRNVYITYLLLGAASMSAIIYAGGMYVISYLAISLLILSAFTKYIFRAYKLTIMMGLIAIGFSSFELIPSLLWVKEFPDAAYVNSTSTLPFIVDIFLRKYPHGSYILPNQLAGWHEYGAYVGYGVLFLSVLGLSTIQKSRIVRLLCLAAMTTILVATTGPLLEPILNTIPFIPRSNISRLALLSSTSLALLAGIGLDVLKTRLRVPLLPVIIAGLIVIDLYTLAVPQLKKTFSLPPVETAIPPAPYPIAYSNTSYTERFAGYDYERSYPLTKAGYGTFTFCTVIGPTTHVTPYNENPDRPFALFTNTKKAATVSHWSANSFTLTYDIPNDDTILINENYAKGWASNHAEIFSADGQLAMKALKGNHRVTITYHPPGMWIGIIVTLTSIAGSIFVYVRSRKEPTGHLSSHN